MIGESSFGWPGVEPEKKSEVPAYGANVVVHNLWNRHAQKKSGEVVATGGGELSTSTISEGGARASYELGLGMEGAADGVKTYASTTERTQETAEEIIRGYQESNPDSPVRNMRVKAEISQDYPPEFLSLYDEKFVASRKALMEDMGLDPSTFKQLSPDQQEQIAEKAEEPVMSEWLTEGSRLGELYPAEAASRKFAALFDRHNGRIAKKLYSNSDIDLIHVSHRGMMEPFLVSGVLIRESDGERVSSLEELGGAMAILEGWESTATTDEEGNANTTVEIRGVSYKVDLDRLKDLCSRDAEVKGE